MKPVMAIDIDDTLMAFTKLFIIFLNSKYKTNFQLKHVVFYDLTILYHVPYQELVNHLNEFMNTVEVIMARPFNNSKLVNAELSEIYDLHLVTARNIAFSNHTYSWISKHYSNIFSDIHFCNFYNSNNNLKTKITKADMCKKIGAIGLIDDSCSNIVDTYNAGLLSILYGKYPWHIELPNDVLCEKASNWLDIRDKLLVPQH
jgi:uncharacterized HAD superfamily protein